MKHVGIIVFLGTQCERDTEKALTLQGLKSKFISYKDSFNTTDFSSYILPGGFSYGDYLRSGALASKSQAVQILKEEARKGKSILGICNGFQILCEVGLLPGVLLKNKDLLFKDIWVDLKPENSSLGWGQGSKKDKIKLPIAHGDGRYYVDSDGLKQIQDQGQIWFTYKDNPNGSVDSIAGILNKNKNVSGMMPHPERAMDTLFGSEDGRSILRFL